MNRRKMFSAALLGTAITGLAQEVTRERAVSSSQHVMVTGEAGAMSAGMGPGKFAFVTAYAAEAGQTVLNAPYAADAVSETTRILSDGTRIVNKNSTSMARDKEGRTRREASIGNIGPWSSADTEAPRFVTVTDPVAKEVYVLNLTERTANKSKFGEPTVFRSETKSGTKQETFESRVHVSGAIAAGGVVKDILVGTPGLALPAMSGQLMYRRFDSRNGTKENLGKRTMEGVVVEGTRTTNTIPAGEIGNDRPIVSTEESWYSAELQMVIYTRNVDPQFGETEYKVTNLRRGDPDSNLFKIPADFKVNEGKSMTAPIMIRKKAGETI